MAERLAAPVLAPVEDFSGMTGGVLRAEPVDIEVLAIGRPPARPHGYGIGLVADAPLREVSRALRSLGVPHFRAAARACAASRPPAHLRGDTGTRAAA